MDRARGPGVVIFTHAMDTRFCFHLFLAITVAHLVKKLNLPWRDPSPEHAPKATVYQWHQRPLLFLNQPLNAHGPYGGVGPQSSGGSGVEPDRSGCEQSVWVLREKIPPPAVI